MKPTNSLRNLKILAKRYARANRIPQHQALDLIAAELKFSHWNALVRANKDGWQPTSEDIAVVEGFFRKTHPTFHVQHDNVEAIKSRFEGVDPVEEGKIGDHPFRMVESLGDVYLTGEGWSIHISEAPYARPRVEIAEQSSSSNPINDADFLKDALQIAQTRSEQARAGIASDWPRRSTKPDAEGKVRHPLRRGLSDKWLCLHCNSGITGQQIADSLWHCPTCNASPLDIVESGFWLDDGEEQPGRIQDSGVGKNAEPIVELVDTRLKLELNEKNITLLIRSALLEDATNISERLGALLAEISVDEENDAWVVFDEDLWPEDKNPIQALAVANLLGIELDQALTCMTAPFAWPGLGEHTSSTYEYTKMLLDAYAKQGTVRDSE